MKTKSSYLRGNNLFFGFLALLPSFLTAQTIEGDWYGKITYQGIVLRISIHVKAAEQGYTTTWEVPEQGITNELSTNTSFNYPNFSFSHIGVGFKYDGLVNPDYTEISGKWEQGDTKLDLNFGRNPIAADDTLHMKYDKQEVYITMRDGVKLFTSIYIPKNHSVQHPILLNRTPYNIEPGGPENFNIFMQLYSRYTEEEYIMVFQDVRGCYMSEGQFEDIRPVIPVKNGNKDIDETTDTWDTVEWLVQHVEKNNRKVGIFGISYPGFYSTMGIINAHPAVKAVSPQAPVTSWFVGDDFHHNGAFFLQDCFSFFYTFGRPRQTLTRTGNLGFNYPVPDNFEFFLSLGPIKNIAVKYFGDSIRFWNDAFAHPDYDDFWKARDPREYLKNVTPAVMTVGGWFDAEDLYGTLHTYEAIESQNSSTTSNYLVMGPWTHGQWAFGEGVSVGNIGWGFDANTKFIEVEKDFFNYYLKGEGNPYYSEAQIFVTGSNEWRDFANWPPKNVTVKNLYFHSNEIASFDAPLNKSGFDEYCSDPFNPVPYTEDVHTDRTTAYMTDDQRFASRRPDVMTYQTSILTEDITLTGPLTADLFVSTTGTDADYIVKLVDVFPPDTLSLNFDNKYPLGGYQMLVRGEVFRGRYRNSFEKPVPFVPGKVTEIKYELPDVAHTFKKGHRIMIQVQNSWFPLVDRNPQKFVNIYECSESDFQKATHRIYYDSDHSSHIKINVLQ